MPRQQQSYDEAMEMWGRMYCEQIRKCREEAGWSIDRCARLLGRNPAWLELIERQGISFTPKAWWWLSLLVDQIRELSYAEQRIREIDGPSDNETERLRNVIHRAQDVLDEA